MCYYGSQFPKGIKKDQGHFNLMSDLHTLVRDAQQNLFHGKEGKQVLVKKLHHLIALIERGDYTNVEIDVTKEALQSITSCSPTNV